MIDLSRAQNMVEFLKLLEEQSGDRTIMKYMACGQVCEMSGREFFHYVDRCAGQIGAMGLAGKHVGIMGINRWQWMAYLCGIFRAGAVAVLMSPDLNSREVRARARQTDLAAIICDNCLAETAQRAELPVLNMDEIPETVFTEQGFPAQPEDLACILFTSGTTSQCRAAMFTHKALIAGFCHNVIGFPFRSMLAILPMHHIAGFASVINTWYLGREVCMGEQMKHLYRYLAKMKPDYVLTVPALLQVILKKVKNAGANGNDIGWDLHMIGCGGAQFPADVIHQLNSLNIRVLQSYGATEAGGLGFDWEMTPYCKYSIGKPCDLMETKIVDGELYLRCESMMSGYYHDPESTQEVLKDGWYATGDLCEQDAEGYLYFRGRKNNLIILANGENVSPEEIEMSLLLEGLPGEVLVGVEKGQITAWIYPEQDAAAEVILNVVDHYNETVPRYKQIQNAIITAEPFKRTAVGKTKRKRRTGG